MANEKNSPQSGNLGELDVIARFARWAVLGTLTFRGEVPSQREQRKLVYSYLYKVSDFLSIPYHRLVWATRHEHGERLGRSHYHVLLGGARKRVGISQCFQLNHLWSSLPRAGFARHYVYDGEQHGVEYLCKALTDRVAESHYEVGKFGLVGSEVTLSDSLCRAIGGHDFLKLRDLRFRSAGKMRQRATTKERPMLGRDYGLHPYAGVSAPDDRSH